MAILFLSDKMLPGSHVEGEGAVKFMAAHKTVTVVSIEHAVSIQVLLRGLTVLQQLRHGPLISGIQVVGALQVQFFDDGLVEEHHHRLIVLAGKRRAQGINLVLIL